MCVKVLYGFLWLMLMGNSYASEGRNDVLPQVTIPQGNLLGINLLSSKYNRSISGFLGIPYGQPPIGNLRFSNPIAAESWDGTFNASTDGNACLQAGNIGDEDCLYLNVFKLELPANSNSSLLPVMVYIPGGGFATGSSDSKFYGPGYLLDEDVVLVTINYRVGALGFFSTGDEVASGNWGMKDQVLALHWVQDNIEYFGGDRNRVTIFGQSAGGSSVQLLALSESTIGLFHNYISQSGAAFGTWVYRSRPTYKNVAFQLGEFLNCPTDTSSNLVECLRGIDSSEIINTVENFAAAGNRYPLLMWGPTDEPEIEGAFLTDTPANLFANGKIRDLPSMTGSVPDEGVIFLPGCLDGSGTFDEFLDNFDDVLVSVMDHTDLIEDVPSFITAVKELYYNNDLTSNRTQAWSNTANLLSDSFFIYQIYQALKKQTAVVENIPYFYSFEYRGTYSGADYSGNEDMLDTTILHGDDLIYLFPQMNSAGQYTEINGTDLLMRDTMVQLWTSFATNGIPTTTTTISNVTWLPSTSEDRYLQIGSISNASLEIKYNFLQERMEFWNELTAIESLGNVAFISPLLGLISILIIVRI